MAVETSITPADVAIALGRQSPDPGSVEAGQWRMWIGDALLLIEDRIARVRPGATIDQAKIDYVVRESVVAQVKRPDSAMQVTVSVDDGSTSKTYASGRGRVTISDDLWALLGLAADGGHPYAVDTAPVSGQALHAQVCSVRFGGLCSCGAALAGYPLWEKP